MRAWSDRPSGSVRKYLDLSIRHLPPELRFAEDVEGATAYELSFGMLLYVPEHPDDWAEEGDIAPEVLAIQRFARERGCTYVLLDIDAPQVDGLPTWDDRS